MKELLLCVHSVVKTLDLEISRCYLADHVKEMYLSTCRTTIFPHSTNQIIVFWRRPFLSSLMTTAEATRARQIGAIHLGKNSEIFGPESNGTFPECSFRKFWSTSRDFPFSNWNFYPNGSRPMISARALFYSNKYFYRALCVYETTTKVD